MSVRYDRCPFDLLENYVPTKGKILDFGCGHGLFSNVMSMKSVGRDVIGLDLSAQKIEIAKKSINGRKNISFMCGRLEDVQPNSFMAVTIIDVLYLLSQNHQTSLLRKIRKSLDVNGLLMIKEVPETPGVNFKTAYLKEFAQVHILKRTLGECFTFRTEDGWERLLMETGYHVESIRLDTPTPSTLFLCR